MVLRLMAKAACGTRWFMTAGLKYRPDGLVDRDHRNAGKESDQRDVRRPALDILYVTSMAKPPLPRRFRRRRPQRGSLFAIYGRTLG